MTGSFTKFCGKICVGILSKHWKTLFGRGFILKPTERAQVLLKKSTRDFENNPAFARSACFYVTISGVFERFPYFNFETDFLVHISTGNRNLTWREYESTTTEFHSEALTN